MKALPNAISIFRICLVPVFIIVYFADPRDIKYDAALIYAVAAFSDFLDGFLARKLQAMTRLGKVLDPLGDKLMTVSVMVCITIDGIIPIWAVLVAGIKEIMMAIGGYVIHKLARVEIPPANLLGKASTVLFFVVCVVLMIFRTIPRKIAIILISAALAVMLIALATYINTYITVMKKRHIETGPDAPPSIP